MIRQTKIVTYSFKSISRFRKIVGVFLGLGYAAVFYAFQFTLREFLRVASTSEFNEMWMSSEEETAFYNWFAAALSLLIGQSICLGYWFSRPKRFRERGIRSRSTIINDQRVMQVSFLMWFLKLGFLYAVFFGLTWQNGHYGAGSIYPNFAIMFILVILVLFFQSWNTIRLKFKIKSYEWMVMAFFALGLSSWGISKINVVDYKAVNEAILAENIWYSYDLQIPSVANWDEPRLNVDFVIPSIFFRKNGDSNLIYRWEDRRWRPVYNGDDYQGASTNWCQPRTNRYDVDERLYIDKRIKMGIVKQIWNDLLGEDVIRVSYAVLPDNAVYPAAAYHGTVINAYVPYIYAREDNYLVNKARLDAIPNQIRIVHKKIGGCNVNGRRIDYDNLENELFELFISNTDFRVEYIFSDTLPFDDYIQFTVAVNSAIDRVRDFFSWDERGEGFNELHEMEQADYRKKYPLRISTVSANFLQSQK